MHLAPERLRRRVLLVTELPAALGERLRLVQPAEHAERPAEHRKVRRQDVAQVVSLELRRTGAQVARGRLVVAGQDGDVGEVVLSAVVGSELEQPLVRVQRERPGFVETVEHCDQPGLVEQDDGMGRFREQPVEPL